MKKKLLVPLSVLAVMTAVVGCGDSSGGNGGSSSSGNTATEQTTQQPLKAQPDFPKVSGNVTITYWTWQQNADRIVKAFEKAYPNITVKLENVGSQQAEYSKLATAIKSGSGAPDVVMLEYSVLPQFIQSGGLADISKYDGSMKAYFLPWAWSQVSVGSKLYAIPQDDEPMVLDYRVNDLKKANLSVPTTWSQFASDAKAYYQATGKPYSVIGSNDSGVWTALLWQAGVYPTTGSGNNWKIDFNSPQAKKVMSFWGNLIASGAVKAEPFGTPAYFKELGQGDYPMLVGAPWYSLLFDYAVPKQAGQWKAAMPPQWSVTGTPHDGNYGGSANAVTTQSKQPEAAALFAAWYTASTQAIDTALTPFNKGGMGALWTATNVPKSSLFDSKDPYFVGQQVYPLYEKAAKQVNTSFQWSPWTSYISNEMSVEFTKAVEQKETFSQALDNIQNSVVNFAKSEGYNVSQ